MRKTCFLACNLASILMLLCKAMKSMQSWALNSNGGGQRSTAKIPPETSGTCSKILADELFNLRRIMASGDDESIKWSETGPTARRPRLYSRAWQRHMHEEGETDVPPHFLRVCDYLSD